MDHKQKDKIYVKWIKEDFPPNPRKKVGGRLVIYDNTTT